MHKLIHAFLRTATRFLHFIEEKEVIRVAMCLLFGLTHCWQDGLLIKYGCHCRNTFLNWCYIAKFGKDAERRQQRWHKSASEMAFRRLRTDCLMLLRGGVNAFLSWQLSEDNLMYWRNKFATLLLLLVIAVVVDYCCCCCKASTGTCYCQYIRWYGAVSI